MRYVMGDVTLYIYIYIFLSCNMYSTWAVFFLLLTFAVTSLTDRRFAGRLTVFVWHHEPALLKRVVVAEVEQVFGRKLTQLGNQSLLIDA